MDEAISAHASEIREGRLPKTCAIILAVSESYRASAAVAGDDGTAKARQSAGKNPTLRQSRRRRPRAGQEANMTQTVSLLV